MLVIRTGGNNPQYAYGYLTTRCDETLVVPLPHTPTKKHALGKRHARLCSIVQNIKKSEVRHRQFTEKGYETCPIRFMRENNPWGASKMFLVKNFPPTPHRVLCPPKTGKVVSQSHNFSLITEKKLCSSHPKLP